MLKSGIQLRALFVALMAFLCIPQLNAQSYQSSFSDINVDRIKSSFGQGNIYNVEPSSGALNINIPLGEGIGTNGVHFTPTVYGHFAQQCPIINYYDGMGTGTTYFQSPTFLSLLPGHLDLKLHPYRQNESNRVLSEYELFNGVSGTFGGAISSVDRTIDANGLIKAFGYATEQAAVMQPFGEGTAEPFIKFTSSGDIFIAISDPTTAPSVPYQIQAVWGNGSTIHTVYIPSKVLLIHGDIAYEFTTLYDESAGSSYRPPYDLYFDRYRLTSIRNKFQERVDISYAGGANVMDYTASWIRNNVPTGLSVIAKYQNNKFSVTYPEDSDGPYVVDSVLTYPDLSQPFWAPWSGFAADMFSPNTMDIKWLETGMYQQVNSITNTATGQTTKFTYAPYGAGGGPKFLLPTSITFPNSSHVDFEWGALQYVHNDADNGIWQGYFRVLFVWTYHHEYWKTVYAWGINSIKRVDSNGETRTTLYHRMVPTDLNHSTRNQWASLDFYTAIENPDHSVLLNVYWSPVNNTDGGPGTSIDVQNQTLAHLKHVLKEQRFYAPGVDWASDRTVSPSNSKAFKIIQYGDLDIRRDGIPAESINSATIPTTRTITTSYLDTSVVETIQLQNWVGAPDYTWKDTQKTVSLNGAIVYQALSSRTYSSLPQFGIIARKTSEVVTITKDTGKGLAVGYPQNSEITPHDEITFDNANSILNKVKVEDLVAGTQKISTNLFYLVDSGYQADKLDHINVNSANFVGTPGINSYQYDQYGRINLITPTGVTWSLGQYQDWQGRPCGQTDANGITTGFRWDNSGRLTDIIPPNREVLTHVSYDADQCGASITKSAQNRVERYNGFGENILIRRLNGDGTYNHKVFAYDLMGRKTMESVWLSGPGADAEGKSYAGAATHYAYNDPQGRLTDQTDPNGSITHIQYLGLVKKVTKGYSSTDAETTTYSMDPVGRLIEVTDALGQVTDYAYTPAGKIATVTQFDSNTGVSQKRTWAYNPFGWLTSISQPESGTTTYSDFTVLGKPQTTTYVGDGTGPARVVRTTYDSIGRVKSNISDDGTVSQTFNYDEPNRGASNGKLTTATSNGITRALGYGGLNGRLSDYNYYIDGLAFTQSIIYDGTRSGQYGLPVTRTYPNGDVQSLAFDYTSGLPISCGFSSSPTPTDLVNNIAYAPDFWGMIQITYANGATSFFNYDADQTRLHSITHSASNLLNKTWTYSYDMVGRLKNDQEDYYTYDVLDRLKSIFSRDPFDAYHGSGPIGLYQVFNYDAFGNRTFLNSFPVSNWPSGTAPTMPPTSGSSPKALNYALNPSDPDMYNKNHLPRFTTTNVPTGAAYDAQGNLTQVFNQPTSVNTPLLTMTYDAMGRVTTLGDSKNATSQTFTYDDQGLRVKVVDSASGGKVTYYIYNEARQLVSVFELVKE